MAAVTINLTFEEALLERIDIIAEDESRTRADIIHDSIKMYIDRKQKLRELFAYGESIASENSFTEDDVTEEIKNYRQRK
jgi:predicted transcriptional regulator